MSNIIRGMLGMIASDSIILVTSDTVGIAGSYKFDRPPYHNSQESYFRKYITNALKQNEVYRL